MGMKGSLLIMAAMFAAVGHEQSGGWVVREERHRSPEELKEKEKELNRRKGLKEFHYGYDSEGKERVIWSIREKTADKKAKKRGWI